MVIYYKLMMKPYNKLKCLKTLIKNTTIDGDSPVIIRTSAPTVATPTNFGISGLQIDDENP